MASGPTPPGSSRFLTEGKVGFLPECPDGFPGCPFTGQPIFLLRWSFDRDVSRCSSGPWPGGGHLPPFTDNFSYHPGIRRDHAGRDLLRSHVRRFHHLDPGEHPGRGGFRGHLPGRLPDGPPGTGRPGPGHRGLRLLHRGNPRGRRPHARGSAAGRNGPEVRPAGIFFPDDRGVDDPHLPGQRADVESPAHGLFRPFPGLHGDGLDHGDDSLYL